MSDRIIKTSPGGREFVFVLSDPDDGDPSRFAFARYEGLPAGKVFRDDVYRDLPYHATTRELYWRKAADAPVGVGFDVAAFETLDEVLTAWMRNADQILDWDEGKPVSSIVVYVVVADVEAPQ